MRLGILTAVAFALLTTDARAAIEPPQSSLAPGGVAQFEGTIDTKGQLAVVEIVQGETGSMHGVCVEPFCQSGTIDVAGGSAGKLHVAVGGGAGANSISVEVVRPDGTAVFDGSGYSTVSNQRHLVLDAPADGAYTVRVAGEGSSSNDGIAEFAGGAWLEMPGGSAHSGIAVLDQIACPLLRTYDYPALPGGAAGAPVNDPLYAQQWGLEQIKVPAAWKRGFSGKGVKIAVIDSGVDFDHPEFAGRVLPGKDVMPDESADCGPGPDDDHGHGTGVASIAAAGANDGIGIAGIAHEAEIMPIKVGNAEGTYWNRELIAGLRHAIDAGADVINMSLGGDEKAVVQYGPEEDPRATDALVQEAWEKGIVVVAGAGNLHEPLCMYPARAPRALCVAGTDRDGLPSDFSALPNGDAVGNGVRAPAGADVKSETNGCAEWIVMAWFHARGGNCELGSRAYLAGYGTSMATPHVAGLAALLKQAGLSNEQIVERIRMTASNKGASDPVMGYGLVDADAATEGLKPLPPGQVGKPQPPRPGAKPRTVKPSRACRAARKSARRATKRAVGAKKAVRRKATRSRKRTLARRLKTRDRAVRLVARRCR